MTVRGQLSVMELIMDMELSLDKDPLEHKAMKWSMFDRQIEIRTYDGYTRSPHWSNTYEIELIFYEQCNKGYFNHTIICKSQKKDESEWIDEDKAKSIINDLIEYISSILDALFKGKPFKIDLSDDLHKEIAFCIFEGFKGPTEEERNEHEEMVAERNRKCEEFHKSHPYYAIEVMLKPGLSTILLAELIV
jgi:hypothetical protein